ncbi:hypothetical protein PSTG_12974 [Puccinia striiformis f. sp. tritici PST-78]|uniref:Uncharacterized protein n=1 Tax=Puccinia striiformis f. sp. tritici PST-78 TaxID=1165861 RepID=A0A0L0V321_9BASI|nr:hypothetical protein PSTG_12974 [Puccinia striiformis f. sp. tritici PST-78]
MIPICSTLVDPQSPIVGTSSSSRSKFTIGPTRPLRTRVGRPSHRFDPSRQRGAPSRSPATCLPAVAAMQLATLTYLGIACTLFISQAVCPRPPPPDMFCETPGCPRTVKTLKVTESSRTLSCGAIRGTDDCDHIPMSTKRQCSNCSRIVTMATEGCRDHQELKGSTLE